MDKKYNRMDKDYLLEHLLQWAKVFYGKDDSTCFSKMKKGLYIFGNHENKNVLSHPLAVFLCIGELPEFKPKTFKKGKKWRKKNG